MLPISMPIGMAPVGAAGPRLEIIYNSQPLYTKGWVTLRLDHPGQWSELVLEVLTPPTLPTSAHVHVVVTPVISEERNVSRPDPYREANGRITPYPNWPDHDAVVVPTVRLSDEWLGDPSHAFIGFQDRVFSPPIAQARQVSSDSPLLRPLEVLSPDLPMASGRGAISRLWQSGWSHPASTGREAEPGSALQVTLPAFPSTWTAARIAVAFYHQDASGEDAVFRLDQSGGTVPADTQNYTNDPFFLARPWAAIGQDPLWLSNWHFLHPSTPPWTSLSSEPVTIGNPGPSQWYHFQGELPEQPYALYDVPSLLPWLDIVGREQALWLLAWTTNLFELDRWKAFQPVPTNDNPNNFLFVPHRRALLPSHSFLAEWSHLAESLLLPTAPFFDVSGPFPKRWVLPGYQFSPLVGGSQDIPFQSQFSFRYREQGLVALTTSAWDPYRSHPNPVVEGQLSRWPKVFETGGPALASGTSFNHPLDPVGSSVLFQPSLPPLFHQWEAYTGTEWMTMVLHAHGVWWGGIKDWVTQSGGWSTFSQLLGIDTEFLPWWTWVNNEIPILSWSEPPADQVMPVMGAGSIMGLLYGNAGGSNGPMGTSSDILSNYTGGGAHGLNGLESMSQPVFTIQTVSYAIQRIRLYGKPR